MNRQTECPSSKKGWDTDEIETHYMQLPMCSIHYRTTIRSFLSVKLWLRAANNCVAAGILRW
ncbi:MAG: hypothetical protein ABIF19_08305 [Planctomycetota bacterium]